MLFVSFGVWVFSVMPFWGEVFVALPVVLAHSCLLLSLYILCLSSLVESEN